MARLIGLALCPMHVARVGSDATVLWEFYATCIFDFLGVGGFSAFGTIVEVFLALGATVFFFVAIVVAGALF